MSGLRVVVACCLVFRVDSKVPTVLQRVVSDYSEQCEPSGTWFCSQKHADTLEQKASTGQRISAIVLNVPQSQRLQVMLWLALMLARAAQLQANQSCLLHSLLLLRHLLWLPHRLRLRRRRGVYLNSRVGSPMRCRRGS